MQCLKFDRIENKRNQRPDLHAWLLLDELFPDPGRDMVSAAEHDEIWLDVEGKKLETLTDEQIGYRLTRPDCGGWMFLGTDHAEVGKALGHELENNEGLPADECGQIVIEAFEITQEEIDNMPEFPGW